MNRNDETPPHIDYCWDIVEVEKGVPFAWGSDVSAYMKKQYSKPGVYRWEIWNIKSLRAVYIGEAENIATRIRKYLRPGSKESTNLRIHEILEKSAHGGFKVRLETLVFVPTLLNTVRVLNENLSDAFLRGMLENFVIADTDTTQITLLNRVPNRIERRIDKAERNNPFMDALGQAGFDLANISL